MTPDRFVLDDPVASRAGLVCLAGLGGFLLWAGLVPMDEGIAATGKIVVEENRKVVQHLEGGILRRLRVHEGSMVREGDLLLVLDDVKARAERDQIAQRVAALRASRDRLAALDANAPQLVFSDMRDLRAAPAKVAEIQMQEQAMFVQQRAAYLADTSVLGARRGALASTADAKQGQIAAVTESLRFVETSLARQRALLAEKLVRRDVVDSLEQQHLNLRAELARLATEKGESVGQANEVGQQLGKSRADFLAQVSSDLLKTRTDLQAGEEQLRAAADVLRRTRIVAPRSGKVLNLAFSTIGGVVRPGEPILEIVPPSPVVIAQVQIKPNERDAVYVGLPVSAKLRVNKSWTAPSMTGRVLDVSGDLKTIQQTGASFYEARIRLTPSAEVLRKSPVMPGMPIEASINSGVRRTFLSYLVEPLRDVVTRAL